MEERESQIGRKTGRKTRRVASTTEDLDEARTNIEMAIPLISAGKMSPSRPPVTTSGHEALTVMQEVGDQFGKGRVRNVSTRLTSSEKTENQHSCSVGSQS